MERRQGLDETAESINGKLGKMLVKLDLAIGHMTAARKNMEQTARQMRRPFWRVR